MESKYSLAKAGKFNARQIKSLNARFAKTTKNPNNNIIYGFFEENVCIWYILIRNISGINDEFKNGEYLFKMIPHDDYPAKPPRFKALTPNGVFELGEVPCIEIGEYHAKNFRPAMGMDNFATELMNVLVDNEYTVNTGGINLISNTTEIKRKFAQESQQYNDKNHPEIIEMLKNHYEAYSSQWDISGMPESEQKKYIFRGIAPKSCSISTKEEIPEEVSPVLPEKKPNENTPAKSGKKKPKASKPAKSE